MSTPLWKIDASHSSVHFIIRHLVISRVRGAFARWQGTIQFDEEDPLSSRVSVQIEAASIDTNEPKRDAHLRSADFLDVERYPTLTFESTRIEALLRRRYRVSGDLTMHGIVKPVDLDVELLGESKDPWGNERIGFAARHDQSARLRAAVESAARKRRCARWRDHRPRAGRRSRQGGARAKGSLRPW